HACVLTIRRRHVVLLIHNLSRYILILHGLRAPDFKKLPDLIRQAFSQALAAEGMAPAAIDRYLALAGPVRYTRTTDRSIVGTLNRTGLELSWMPDTFDDELMIQTRLSLRFGSHIHLQDNTYRNSREVLLPAVERLTDDSVGALATARIDAPPPPLHPALLLRVSLECGDMNIWRRIAVPAGIRFSRLHKVIQNLFCWRDCHLHEFRILDPHGRLVASSYQDLDELDYNLYHPDVEWFSERSAVSSRLSQGGHLLYRYDFGDGWEHSITWEEPVEAYDGPLPVCLDGAGTAPPEDVGGPGGYTEFLDIVRQVRNSRKKQEMLEWAACQEWRAFDLQDINRRLLIFR
ncbi:MAG: hypothetical protein KBA30_11440, partial [Clostridia bacterium]|nr:hypothetical protein [Clostridia bacterium]